jgi:hypothetical protein
MFPPENGESSCQPSTTAKSTHQFKKGSLDGVPVCPASAQKETTG